jgi:hypothetical protein
MILSRLKAWKASNKFTASYILGWRKYKQLPTERSSKYLCHNIDRRYLFYYSVFRAIEDAIERLDVLIALRKAPESAGRASLRKFLDTALTYILSVEKRIKRPRPPSPSSTPVPPAPAIAVPNRVSITLPARNSVGPAPAAAFSRGPKAQREILARQLPLQENRKVAFHQPSGKPSVGGKPTGTANANADTGENNWILAVVVRCLNNDKNRLVWNFLLWNLHFTFVKSDMRSKIQNRKRMGSPDCKAFYSESVRIAHSTLNSAVITPHSKRSYRFRTLMLRQDLRRIYLLIRNFLLAPQLWRFIQIPVASIGLRLFLLRNTHSKLEE